MANVTFPRKEFEKHVKITKEVEEKISLLGTPLESLSAEEIEIEIFPNRPDLLSMHGYLRALKSFLGKEKGIKSYKIKKPLPDYKVTIDSSVKQVRPYTTCAIVRNLTFDDEKIKEIVNFQEKIHNTLGRNRKKVAIGVYPLEKIKLPITYKALPPSQIKFQPLESPREMTASQILTRHPTGRDYAHLLEGFDLYPVFVDANNKVLSMPPIINSHETGKVTKSTKDIFIECSGSDLEILTKTLNILVTTLADMGGTVYEMNLSSGITTPNLSTKKIKISIDKANKLLGLNLKETDVQKLLPKMGIEYKNKNATIPSWRTDILHENDIYEDIAIAYGYNNLTPEIPNIATPGSQAKKTKIVSKISEILIGLQLQEISTYHLIKPEEAEKAKVEDPIHLLDSKTEYKILRPDLLISTFRTLTNNKDNEYPQKIFEIGEIFSREQKEETGVKETLSLCIAITPGNFTDAKQTLDYLFNSLGIEYELRSLEKKPYIEGRTGQIMLNNKPIGTVGEIRPKTLKTWNLKLPLTVIELSLEEIINQNNS